MATTTTFQQQQGREPVWGLPLLHVAQDPRAADRENPHASWVLVSQFRTGGCYKGKAHAFPDQVPVELAHLVTPHEWLSRVYPEISECLTKFVNPMKYNYCHIILTAVVAIQFCFLFLGFLFDGSKGSRIVRVLRVAGRHEIAIFFFIPVFLLMYYAILDGKAGQVLNAKLNELNVYFSTRGIAFYNIRDHRVMGGRLNFAIHARIAGSARSGPTAQSQVHAAPQVTHYIV